MTFTSNEQNSSRTSRSVLYHLFCGFSYLCFELNHRYNYDFRFNFNYFTKSNMYSSFIYEMNIVLHLNAERYAPPIETMI